MRVPLDSPIREAINAWLAGDKVTIRERSYDENTYEFVDVWYDLSGLRLCEILAGSGVFDITDRYIEIQGVQLTKAELEAALKEFDDEQD